MIAEFLWPHDLWVIITVLAAVALVLSIIDLRKNWPWS